MYLNIVRLGRFDEGYALMGVSLTESDEILHSQLGVNTKSVHEEYLNCFFVSKFCITISV